MLRVILTSMAKLVINGQTKNNTRWVTITLFSSSIVNTSENTKLNNKRARCFTVN